MLEINEHIDVWVLFTKGKIQPSVFFWKGRQIKINKVNLVHTSKNGGNILHHFSVSSNGNFYKLTLDLQDLKWMLEVVEEEV